MNASTGSDHVTTQSAVTTGNQKRHIQEKMGGTGLEPVTPSLSIQSASQA